MPRSSGRGLNGILKATPFFGSFSQKYYPTRPVPGQISRSILKRQSATTGGAHGEGTFDFIGVGGALQSRHYTGGIIQDDVVGKKAIESAVTMASTIDYHQLLMGAFENEDPDHEGDELVVGNRWGYHDLNSYIREHEPWFKVISHSALGGCCNLHPLGYDNLSGRILLQ